LADQPINRREFLGRCTRAGLSVAAAGALGVGFYDGRAPEMISSGGASVQIPDFSIAEMKAKICIARGMAQGMDRAAAVQQAFAALGGMKTFVKPGERVLLKGQRRLCLAARPGRHLPSGSGGSSRKALPGRRRIPGHRDGQPHQ
jgi:hypothetical protein